jgi:hypothetical protein
MLIHNVVLSFLLEDCMVRYVHQFSFIPHTYDLTMFMMAHKGGLDKISHRSL